MKKIEKNKPSIKINKSLEQYKDKILFPEKLARANAMLRETGLPEQAITIGK